MLPCFPFTQVVESPSQHFHKFHSWLNEAVHKAIVSYCLANCIAFGVIFHHLFRWIEVIIILDSLSLRLYYLSHKPSDSSNPQDTKDFLLESKKIKHHYLNHLSLHLKYQSVGFIKIVHFWVIQVIQRSLINFNL